VEKPMTALEWERLPPDGKDRRDRGVSGLFHTHHPTGKRSASLHYRLDGKQTKDTLHYRGTDAGEKLRNSRADARGMLCEVADGIDPRAARKVAPSLPKPALDRVEAVVARFIAQHVRRNLKPGTAREVERILTKELSPWHGRRLSAITKADVHALLDSIIERGGENSKGRAAGLTLDWARGMGAWAVERGLIDHNPFAGVKPPMSQVSRDRVLSDDELRQIWQAAGTLEWPYAAFVKLLILTGARRTEVAAMTWREVDLDEKLWILPKERAKNGVELRLPLAGPAIEILQGLPRISGPGHILTFSGRGPITGFDRAKKRIDTLLLPDTTHWVFHDVRRSVASGMARLGVNLPVIEKVLNHVGGSFGGVAGIYQRHSFAAEMRQAVDTWARHIDGLVSGKISETNVVSLRSGG
jgi:site-specific recombinase XerC